MLTVFSLLSVMCSSELKIPQESSSYIQVRTLETGFAATQTILPFGECILDPDQVVLSEDGTKATTFEFPSPVYCEGGGEFVAWFFCQHLMNIQYSSPEWVKKM